MGNDDDHHNSPLLPLAPPLKIVSPHPLSMPLAAVTRAAGPAGTCDVRGVMLHPVRVPRAAGSLRPSDVPSGKYPRQHLTTLSLRPYQLARFRVFPTQSQVPSGLCSSRASRMLGSLSLASSGHLTPHGQPGSGTSPPGSAPLHRPPSTTKNLRAPACGIVFRASHHASGSPRIAVAALWGLRFGCVVRVVHIGGSRGSF